MFDNSFADQYKFDSSESSENENDEMLDLNMIVNIDDDVDDEIINHVHEFGDASRFSFVVSHYQELSHGRMLEGSDLEVGKTFNNKNITHLVEY